MGPRCSNSWLVRTQNSRSFHKSIMKCLLVFAVALATAHADHHHQMKAAEMGHIQKDGGKPVLTYAAQPLAYSYPVAHPYYTPVVYNHVAPKVQEVTQYVQQPDQVKYVAKPYDVEVKSFEPELVKTNCKNNLGFEVPCKTKREADHHVPTVYTVPQVYAHPVVYNAHHQVAHVAQPTVYKHVAVQQPTVYKYNTKVLPGKVHEVEVPTPQLKHVVEKVPVKPLCTNNFGAPVPCVHNE